MPVLRQKLEERGLTSLYETIELPLTENLAEMEFNGITIDQAMLDEVTDEMKKKVSALEQQAWDQAGEEFNLNSPQTAGRAAVRKTGGCPSSKKDQDRLFHRCVRAGGPPGGSIPSSRP